MTDYLQAALNYVGASPEQVVGNRLDEAAQVYVLIIDNGIKGCPKFTIPLSDLQFKTYEPEPDETAVSKPEPEPVLSVDLDGLTVLELQELAKAAGISYSGLRKAQLLNSLRDEMGAADLIEVLSDD